MKAQALLFLIKILVLGVRRGRREEQLASVRIGYIASIRALQRVVPGLITIDDDLGADRKRFLRDATAQQRIRASAFDHPDVLRPIRIDDFHMNPRVRVYPFDLHDLAF